MFWALKVFRIAFRWGSSTIAVARSASEKITDLLNEVKQKIVASQEENQDRSKIQQDIVALRDQISSITGAAQFNGLNLLSNRKGGATAALVAGNSGAGAGIKNSGEVTILSSLDRSSNGTVKASQIAAGKADLGTQAVTWGVTAVDLAATAVTVSSATAADGASTVVEIVGETTAATLVTRKGSAVLAGDGYAINGLTGLTADSIRYVARDGDTQADIAQGLASLINFEAAKTGTKISATVEGAKITVTNNTGAGLTAVAGAVSTSGTAAGGLDLLGKIDVTTANGA